LVENAFLKLKSWRAIARRRLKNTASHRVAVKIFAFTFFFLSTNNMLHKKRVQGSRTRIFWDRAQH
jgi:hypothetical protein